MNFRYCRAVAVPILSAALCAVQGFPAEIAGRILEDHSGEPLASARVRVWRVGERGLTADLDTDSEGRFRAPNLPEGGYRLEVSKPNYLSVAVALPEQKATTLRLVKLGAVSGRVLDAKNQPVPGAFVFARPRNPGGARSAGMTTAMTDTRGGYRLHGLVPGAYNVAVSLAGTQAKSAVGAMHYPGNANPESFPVSGGEEYRNVDFVFPATPRQTIAGRVVIPEGQGRYQVSLVSVDEPGLSLAMAQTEPDGSFRLEGVPYGSYKLLASGPVRGFSARTLTLGDNPRYGLLRLDAAGQPLQDLSIDVAEGRSASFVLDSEEPLPPGTCPADASLRLIPLEDRAAQLLQEIRVGFEEASRVEGLAPGRYDLMLTNLGESCFQAATPLLDLETDTGSEAVRIVVTPAGSIRGRLVGDSAPRSSYGVVLVPSDTSHGSDAAPVRVAFTDAESRFEFVGLRPGNYRIAARPSEAAPSRWVAESSRMFEIEILAGAPTEVELPAGSN